MARQTHLFQPFPGPVTPIDNEENRKIARRGPSCITFYNRGGGASGIQNASEIWRENHRLDVKKTCRTSWDFNYQPHLVSLPDFSHRGMAASAVNPNCPRYLLNLKVIPSSAGGATCFFEKMQVHGIDRDLIHPGRAVFNKILQVVDILMLTSE